MENWIIWLIIAAILMIVEIMTPAFLFGLFSAGALLTAVLSFFIPELIYVHILFFAISSFLLVVFVRKIFIRYFKKDETSETVTNTRSMIGKKVKIIEAVNNNEGKGAVVIDGVRWRAIAENDAHIEKGVMAEITGLDGIKLIVRRTDNV